MSIGYPDDASQHTPATPDKLISAASTNSHLFHAGLAQLVWYFLSNQAAAVAYVKFYDKASAPTVGTDVPTLTLAIPAGSSANVTMAHPLYFALGLGLGITTGSADADSGAVAAGDVVVNVGYI